MVIGVSKDSVKSHVSFKRKHELPFALLSDPDRKVHERYGVLKPAKMYGKDVIKTDRSTFIIDSEGVVTNVWRSVDLDGHIREVLDAISS